MHTASTPLPGVTKAPQSRGRAAAPSRRRRRLTGRAAVAAFAATLTFLAASAVAATPLTDYSTNLTRVESPNPQAGGQWAQRIRTVPDLTSDGKNEVLVADYRESFGGFTTAGRVYMLDGATRNILYVIDSPQIQANAQFGFVPAVIGDVNGDGKADFVASADGQDTLADGTPCTPPATGPTGPCNQDQGKAWVFSGANGRTLYELNMPNAQGFARFGIWTGRAGDINHDSVPDVIVGASTADVPAGCGVGADGRRLPATALPAGCHADEGEAFIFSGKASDHAGGASGLLRTLNLPASDRAPAPCGGTGAGATPCGAFGIPVQGVGDMTGDGVVDQQVSAPFLEGRGAVYLFSGATGALIRRTDDPAPQAGAQWGLQDTEPLAPGDVNRDGAADYFASGSLQAGPSGEPDAGRSWVFSGATGTVLYEVKDPTPTEGGAFGFSMSRTDYNNDGTPDLYVGQNPHHTGDDADESGGTYVFDGRDGSLLKSLELPAGDAQAGGPGNLGSNLGWTSISPGDLNGDGEPDYVAGAPFQDVNGVQNAGRLYFFLSNVPESPPASAPPPAASVPPPAPVVDPCGTEGAPGYLYPAKMRVARSRVMREQHRLDVYAPITSRADGDVEVTYQGDRRTDTFDAEVTSGNATFDRIRFKEPMTRGQARLGTGIVTIDYKGDADTRPEEVRLRAASRRAELDVEQISLLGERLTARGSVTDGALGVVRLRYSYLDATGTPQVHVARATIQKDGDWQLTNDEVPPQLARCGGYLSILFTGYFERRVRGEMLAYQLNAGQTRRP